MAVLPQLPLTQPAVDPTTGKFTPQFGMWLTSLVANLPPANSRAVVDGNGSTQYPTTIFQGLAAARPATGNPNDIWFSTDNGTIYVVNGLGQWQLVGAISPSTLNITGGARGSVVFQAGPNISAFVIPGNPGDVLTMNSGIPSWQPAASTANNSLFLQTFWT